MWPQLKWAESRPAGLVWTSSFFCLHIRLSSVLSHMKTIKVLKKKMKRSSCFLWQYLRPPSHRLSCSVPAPLTWSSSSTPTLSWETAPLSGRKLSTVLASLRGQKYTESTWPPISCGTWIQTRSTTSACCWLGPEKEELALLDLPLWAGRNVQVSPHRVHFHRPASSVCLFS